MRTSFAKYIRITAILIAVILVFHITQAGTASGSQDRTRFYVYFPVYIQSGAYVIPVEYSVPATSSPAIAAAEALIQGLPQGHGIPVNILSPDTQVLDVTIENRILTVNFSEEIRSINVGAGGESAVLTSIVNTLAQFPEVDSVKILIQGQEADSLAGHIDISIPLFPNYDAMFNIFDDVRQHWSGGAVSLLMLMDIVNGYEDSTFRPENTVTRAEFIKLLVETAKVPYETIDEMPFSDVEGHWCASYIHRALVAGIIDAEDYHTLLKPDEVIPRDEMAYIMLKTSDIFESNHPEIEILRRDTVVSFTDEDEINPKYLNAVLESSRRDFLKGYPDGSFGPANGLKRSEACTVIARIMGISGEQVILLSPRTGFRSELKDIYVIGAASAFEGTVRLRVRAADDTELFDDYTTSANGMGWGMFGYCISEERLAGQSGYNIEVFLDSMKDGSEYSKIILP